MENKITFPKRDHLEGLPSYHNRGLELKEGLKLIFERNYRSNLIEVELVSWLVGAVDNDLTGFGKYAVSNTLCKLPSGQVVKIPFSMLYINPKID